MKSIKLTLDRTIYWIVLSVIGLAYVAFLSNMPNEWFRDRYYYVIYASFSDQIIDAYKEQSILALFFNEPIFLYFNYYLEKVFDPEFIPHIFVGFITSVFFIFLGRNSRNFLIFIPGLFLCLIMPYVLQGELVAIRQGFATSVFILSFFILKDDKKILAVLFLCSLFHSVFFIFTVFYFLNFFVLKSFSFNKKLVVHFFVMLAFASIAVLAAKFFGLRQGEGYEKIEDLGVGGGAFLVFLIVFIYLYFFGNRENRKMYEFAMMGLVVFLTSYFISPIAGRLFNTVIPFVIFLLVSRSRAIDFVMIFFLIMVFLFLFINGSYTDLFAISVSPEEFRNYWKSLISL